MTEPSLFEIEIVDDDNTAVAVPTPWLLSLPIEAQAEHLRRLVAALDSEYRMVADAAERARIAHILSAARHRLDEVGA
jgi:hypothetical protein